MTTRRAFTQRLAGAGALAALGGRAGQAVAADDSPDIAVPRGAAVPRGELAARVRLTAERLTRGGRPEYTHDFILADVALDRRRRFWEFSGDLSGRYVEALALLPPPGGPDLRALVGDILRLQREDGRFGDPALRYSAAEIGLPHMALLWGNGRLLIGLLQHHEATGDRDALQAALRLAGFVARIRAHASDPGVARRVAGQGAFGIICFTQLVEPLVGLSRLTGEARWLELARSIAPSLGPRGIQHAHGYVTTLRGMLDLAVHAKDPAVLAQVERLYADLVSSNDLCWMGGVLEYFGWEDPSVKPEERAHLVSASGESPRDEGCGIADFLRLSLGLHERTGRAEYLERAERCLLNHLWFNQFNTGDFGSRSFYRGGTRPTENVDRAWWCCTMHGYRAFPDVLRSIVREREGVACVDLFLDADWSGAGLGLALRHGTPSPLTSVVTADVRESAGATLLAFRKPSWAAGVRLSVNGSPAETREAHGYLQLARPPHAGDRVELALEHRVEIETRDRRRLAPAELAQPTEGLLFVGPLLYAADDGQEPLFFGEPWLAGNVVSVASRPVAPKPPAGPSLFGNPSRHVALTYEHAGFVGAHPVTLRPIGEQAGREPGITAAWLKYRKQG